jgi:cytoskeletal protein CcmA (bactofilin family)
VWRKEDGNPQASPEHSTSSMNSTTPGKAGASSLGPAAASGKVPACVSQGIKIKGEVTGTEDLFVDGLVEGKITISNSTVTIGPNATVKADITARDLVVRGRAEGKFTATERIQLWHTARVHGDLKSERISIEDGAELSGRVEAGRATGNVGAGEATGHGKKAEANKSTKEVTTNDATATSGATTAGAD